MDIVSIIPEIAARLHVAPSTLVFWLFAINLAARGIARRIPNDATGFWGFVRQSAAILGVEVQSRVTSGVTVADVAKAALVTPPITGKVEAATATDVTQNAPPARPEGVTVDDLRPRR